MTQAIDTTFGQSATSRLVLHYLAHSPGARIEQIAHDTGSRYRWVEKTVSRLAREGILRRTAPNTYAINSDIACKAVAQ